MELVHGFFRAKAATNIRRIHRLLPGTMPAVEVGQTVTTMDALGVAEVARHHEIVDVVGSLGLQPGRRGKLLVQTGERFQAGDVLAERPRLFGKRRLEAPFSGRVRDVFDGKLLLEADPQRIAVLATVPGRVVEAIPERHVVVESTAAVLGLAWASGKLAWGTLNVMDDAAGLDTAIDRFNIDHRGVIVAIGSPLTEAFLRGAVEIRVKGLIASSVRVALLPRLAELEFPVAITQGFGHMPMGSGVLAWLKQFDRREVILDTAQTADSRRRRPEIIIPLDAATRTQPTEMALGVGQQVRILQEPYRGEIGTIRAVPANPRRLSSGLIAYGMMVETAAGSTIFVPYANIQHLG